MHVSCILIFFFNDTATTEIYTLSLHDALPISPSPTPASASRSCRPTPAWARRSTMGSPARPASTSPTCRRTTSTRRTTWPRSEEHTSELQSRQYLVCRLLLEKKTNSSAPTLDY